MLFIKYHIKTQGSSFFTPPRELTILSVRVFHDCEAEGRLATVFVETSNRKDLSILTGK